MVVDPNYAKAHVFKTFMVSVTMHVHLRVCNICMSRYCIGDAKFERNSALGRLQCYYLVSKGVSSISLHIIISL
jgi:hypothetical protein